MTALVTTLLDVKDLHAGYGRAEVLHGIALRAAAGSTPISAFSKVDLPAPFGPITVTTLPAWACRFRPCSTSARP